MLSHPIHSLLVAALLIPFVALSLSVLLVIVRIAWTRKARW
jgi:hypothetical protein